MFIIKRITLFLEYLVYNLQRYNFFIVNLLISKKPPAPQSFSHKYLSD
jgi:hypothetical protein